MPEPSSPAPLDDEAGAGCPPELEGALNPPDDLVGAFCPPDGAPISLAGAAGPLAGLRFAVKDVFDIAGHTTGLGNPDWRRTHAPATATAPVVNQLVADGATLVGRTICDELAFSIIGINPHYGTPRNPATPDTVPGGSSSGSAAATAAGLVDFALGTDTAGSVRVPASVCGLYGFRPTAGVIGADGVVPLAPPFDTIGWFARDALTLWQVATALLPEPAGTPGAATAAPLHRGLIAEDAWAVADAEVVDAMVPELQRLGLHLRIDELPVLAPEGLGVWSAALRTLVGRGAWRTHGPWIEREHPTVSVDTRRRLEAGRSVTDAAAAEAEARRVGVQARLTELLGDDAVLVLPTTPEIAPLLDSDEDELASFRARTLQLTCVASLAGLPQMTVPLVRLAEYPVGLSFIGPAGSDLRLLALAATVTRPAE